MESEFTSQLQSQGSGSGEPIPFCVVRGRVTLAAS